MSNRSWGAEVVALKDESEQQPIPTAWRPVFREIVSAFVKHDYRLESGVSGVEPVSVDAAARIQNYVNKYGATLMPLPEETWDSSICMWHGDFWDALVDLWTREEGRSDLVLSARVREDKLGFAYQIQLVYVP
jgi:hypothetical protein